MSGHSEVGLDQAQEGRARRQARQDLHAHLIKELTDRGAGRRRRSRHEPAAARPIIADAQGGEHAAPKTSSARSGAARVKSRASRTRKRSTRHTDQAAPPSSSTCSPTTRTAPVGETAAPARESTAGNLARPPTPSPGCSPRRATSSSRRRRRTREKLLAAVLDAGADDLQDERRQLGSAERARGVHRRERRREEPRHRAGQRAGRDDSAELRAARRQGRAADVEADGGARRLGRCPARLVELRHLGEGDRGLARVKIFGIDPGSERTGYGCVETDGRGTAWSPCGAISAPAARDVS